jgi:drug/metabolite transporter (DMT)-like permease
MTVTRSRARPRLATAALVGVTAIWGSTFVVVKDAVDRMPVMDFLAFRFLLAALLMLLLRPLVLGNLGRNGLRHGVLLGIPLGVGYVGQTVGLQYTSAAVSGFITGMFVVFTPLIAAVVLRSPVGAAAWTAVALATVGLGLISLRGWAIGPGELLTLSCAFCFAIHIVGLGEWSPQHDPYPLAIVQLMTVAVLCVAAAVPGGITPPPDAAAWLAVVITAVFATALAFVVQTWAQSLLTPTRAAVIMTMEPVFAGLFAALAGESLQQRTLLGGALVIAAMYLVEVGPRRGAEGRQERLEI